MTTTRVHAISPPKSHSRIIIEIQHLRHKGEKASPSMNCL